MIFTDLKLRLYDSPCTVRMWGGRAKAVNPSLVPINTQIGLHNDFIGVSFLATVNPSYFINLN